MLRKRTPISGGIIEADSHRETGLFLHNGGKKAYVWIAGDSLGHLLVLPCSVIKVNVKLQQPNQVG